MIKPGKSVFPSLNHKATNNQSCSPDFHNDFALDILQALSNYFVTVGPKICLDSRKEI